MRWRTSGSATWSPWCCAAGAQLEAGAQAGTTAPGAAARGPVSHTPAHPVAAPPTRSRAHGLPLLPGACRTSGASCGSTRALPPTLNTSAPPRVRAGHPRRGGHGSRSAPSRAALPAPSGPSSPSNRRTARTLPLPPCSPPRQRLLCHLLLRQPAPGPVLRLQAQQPPAERGGGDDEQHQHD